jgi:hypothetical protein
VSIHAWIEGLVKAAVDEAINDAKTDIIAEIQGVEQNLIAQMTSLPGLLGAQIQNVVVDTGAIAAKVVAGIAGQLTSLPQQIIQGVIGGLNPFKGQR